MPLFSSHSVKDSGAQSHHNKLGKSPHARAASLSGRKGSIGPKTRIDEDASIRAMAGSQSRLMHDDSTDTEKMKPLTPKSINSHSRNQSVDQMELNDVPPTPPPHEAGYTKAAAANDVYNANDDTRRDSIRTTSTTTWRENPEAVAMRNRGLFNGTTDNGTAPNGMAGSGSGLVNPGESHDQSAATTKAMDLALAHQKVQIAIDAELAADRALEAARKAVDDARAYIAALERQAHEEYERAYARKMETAGVVKELEKLGRHSLH